MNEAKKENREGLVLKVGRFLKRIAIGVYRVPKSLAIRVYRVLKNLAVTVYRVLKRIVISVYRFLNVFASDRDLTWLQRACVYGGALVLGLVVARCFTASFLCLLGINPHPEYPVIHPKIPAGIFLFGLVVSVGTWIIRTADAKKQFADTLRTQKNATFTEAVRLLVEGTPVSARGAGLAEIAALLHESPEYEKRINLVTASGLRLGEEDPPQQKRQQTGKAEDSAEQKKQKTDNKEDTIKVVLGGADLSKLQMPSADLRGARLQEANLFGVDLRKALLQEARLEKAKLQEAKLQEANLQEARLDGAQLQGAKLQGAQLQGACLSDTNFQGAKLQGAQLQKSNLDEAQLAKAERLTPTLKETKVDRSFRLASAWAVSVPGPNFQGAELQGAILEFARLPEANFKRAELTEARLAGANLQRAQFQGADLRVAASVVNALGVADLEGGGLEEADLQDALYSETTKFPDGFDPDAAGMKLVEDDDDKN